MCQECKQYPCHPSCPNAPEPAVVCKCDNCGGEIRVGEFMWKLDIGNVCEDCIDLNSCYADF